MPDLTPLSDAEWPEVAADLAGGFAGQLNVYRTLAHHPDLLRAWTALREHIVNQTSLGPERSEIVILRTGMRLGSNYEWSHHVARARARGLTDGRIASMKGPLTGMAAGDRVLAAAVDELFAHSEISKETLLALAKQVGKEGVLDLMATVGFYSTLGFALNTFQTPLDGNVAKEMSDNPLCDTLTPDDKR